MKSVEGVSDVDPDIEKNSVTVTYDKDKATIEAMTGALQKAGYPVEGKPEKVQ